MVQNESTSIQNLLDKSSTKQQLTSAQLVVESVKLGEGVVTPQGALSVTTGKYTGRSPKDKYIVEEESIKDKIDWGPVNQPISKEVFQKLYGKVLNHLNKQEQLYVFNGYAGADESTRLPLRVINEFAWHNMFARTMFIRPETKEEGLNINPEFTIVSAPSFKADPKVDGTGSETFIIVSFEEKIILIGGTEYAGEMKKSIFSIMNFLLPETGILSMHCSSNVGDANRTALFFGLSGTGKTTLSADPNRKLIGDDEHGWSDEGVFNIEGGCYAKTIDLSREKEPQIYDAIRFGAVLENVPLDEENYPKYDDKSLTENTRAAYPLYNIDNTKDPSISGHPTTIIFLTADAFGVLPPISKLTKDQAMYHFLSGFTSKLAGTERGITSPQPVFSTCFGSPFLPLHATVYAEMLGKKIDEHDVEVFLVNTGWTGGRYGEGQRMNLGHTRTMVREAIAGHLSDVEYKQDDIFGLNIPTEVTNIPSDILMPRNAWDNKEDYDQQAKELAKMFKENFEQFGESSKEIAENGGFKFNIEN